jgi:hypothetical protein
VTSDDWWQSTELWAALLGVLLGFILAEGKDWWTRRRRRKSHWGALRAELEFCRHLSETYVRDRVIAPLYRLPTTAYSQSFPALLGDAAVAEREAQSLIQFFSEAEALNRGLDLAQSARERGDQEALEAEFKRNLLKAGMLIPPSAGGNSENYYRRARAVLDAHL